ncbi:hypothetical protein BC936DRAFT_137663 [Jimgerdemannia flammicorona]|uniref:Uncharacterized protein n=1 Tax=Jimgerdemannia flammicorona TaxID=994334 RepID=A0A433CWX1_9FUNG|nr:hypothetical protein BC936DRAFT_137663 [Jimgerdemannia flammicorona]
MDNMDANWYRAPPDSATSPYFKSVPLRSWSHKHYFEHTNVLDLKQATRLWFKNLEIIKTLPGSPVNEELLAVIKKRKMADALSINEKKRKHAEDDVHTESITTSAELLNVAFVHHKECTKQKMRVAAPATPTPIPMTEELKAASFGEDSDDGDEQDLIEVTFDQYLDEDFVQEKFLLDQAVFDEDNVDDSPFIFREKNISALFTLYRSEAWQRGQKSGLSIATDYREIMGLSYILLLQADSFSDSEIEKYSRDILKCLRKNLCDTYIVKKKVASDVKAMFREYLEVLYQLIVLWKSHFILKKNPLTALDEDLGVEEAEKLLKRSFTKTFANPADQKDFDTMQFVFLQLMKNIPIKPLDDLQSEGTLVANVISPVLRSFFHNATAHPATWPNTASLSAKARKLANLDPSRAKQPDMIGTVVHNNKSRYEMMFGEVTGDGKNKTIKKNNVDLIRLGVFMKDALDILIQKTGRKDHVLFGWQAIGEYLSSYCMTGSLSLLNLSLCMVL